MILQAHGWTLALLPQLGGSIASLSHAGEPVLRPAPRDATSALDTGCFPLVPYANRIANGTFAFAGQHHRLPLNFDHHPHSLHGLGWQASWQVDRQSADAVLLSHAHDGGAGWPWPYHAQQAITLAERRCVISLRVRNLADTAAPAGLGLHPYFPRSTATRLTASAQQLWLADADMLPTHPAPDSALFGDWRAGAPVEGDGLIDNAYPGWDGTAVIEQASSMVRIAATGAPAFHLYRPPNEAFFCFEPVSHLPDAINRGGMPLLPPGGETELTLTLTVARGADQ